uniref:Ig-like domain-containing protein n=1 Tax=Hucho hucho TaxID=62062 RepID=A0A4W5KCM6_9TELE
MSSSFQVSVENLSLCSPEWEMMSVCRVTVVYPNCSSTTWNYNRAGSTGNIEEVAFGKIKVDKTERLSLGSSCSLRVSNVRAEDAGRYTCLQFLTETGSQHGGDAPVDLSVLTISSTTPVTDLKPDADMTLRCSLLSFMGHGTQCISGVSLSWVPNETGTEPQKYSGSQDPQHSSCDITLNVTLQKKDNNRKWTCTLTEKGNVKLSIDFTSTFSGTSNAVKLPISHIMLFVALTIMAAIVTIHTSRRNRPPKALPPQAGESHRHWSSSI